MRKDCLLGKHEPFYAGKKLILYYLEFNIMTSLNHIDRRMNYCYTKKMVLYYRRLESILKKHFYTKAKKMAAIHNFLDSSTYMPIL